MWIGMLLSSLCDITTYVNIICITQFHNEVWWETRFSCRTCLDMSVPSCNSLINRVYTIADLCNLLLIVATRCNVKKWNAKQINGNIERIENPSIFSYSVISIFPVMPLFNVNPFPGLRNDANRGRRWGKNCTSWQKCNTAQYGQTAGRKISQLSRGTVDFNSCRIVIDPEVCNLTELSICRRSLQHEQQQQQQKKEI